MITRIFRVQIKPELKHQFEAKFADISVQAVTAAKGCSRVAIGKPTKWSPNEYVMITDWQDEQALINFAGTDWNRAVIPPGMEQYVESCSLHHYQNW